jgi:hypothetical protein
LVALARLFQEHVSRAPKPTDRHGGTDLPERRVRSYRQDGETRFVGRCDAVRGGFLGGEKELDAESESLSRFGFCLLAQDRLARGKIPAKGIEALLPCPLSINHRRERESKAIGLGSHASVSSFRLRGSGCYSLAGVAVGDGLASAGVTYGLSIRIFKSSPPRITDQNPLICAGSEFCT